MSMATLERAVLDEAKTVLKNPKLKMKDIMEWSTSGEKVKEGCINDEIAVRCPSIGVWVAVSKTLDKRE